MGVGREFIPLSAPPGGRVEFINWIPPLERETLGSYARRISTLVEPLQPTHLIGVSFGAAIALEVARQLKPSPTSVILIAGPAHAGEWSRMLKIARRFPAWTLQHLISLAFLCAPLYARRWPWFSPRLRALIGCFRMADGAFIRWALPALLAWAPPESKPRTPPVFRIHGRNDPFFRARDDHPIQWIAKGGHAITITHRTEVNKVIQQIIAGTMARKNLREAANEALPLACSTANPRS